MAQALQGKSLVLDEESVEALETLVEVAVRLKEAGILDLLRVVAEHASELLALVSNDTTIPRMAALADGATRGVARLKPEELVAAKMNIEKLTECTLKSVAAVDPAKTKPLGLLGLLGALRDRDVQQGLALLVAVAKNLGACMAGEKPQS